MEEVIIEGYPDEEVILDGTVAIDAEWKNMGNGIYKAVLDLDSISSQIMTPTENIYGVFVDGRYMMPAMPINFKNPTNT